MSDSEEPSSPADPGPADTSWRDKLLEEQPHLHEFLPFLDELNRESDRGVILISCSYLDELLRRTIEAFLADQQAANKLLSGFNAPLGTFSSRISAAKALGLIDSEEYDAIERMRKIRNEFAHSITAKFTDPKIDGLCSTFQVNVAGGRAQLDVRQRFVMTAVSTITRLMNRAHYAGARQLKAQAWPG